MTSPQKSRESRSDELIAGYDVSESSGFCLFIKTDGKSWSFRLRFKDL